MWIVQLALRRPYTIVVLAILIMVMGAVAIFRTPTDIFPNINIPVVSIIWTYNGLVPKEMSDRIVSVTERNLTTVVDNIEHVESQSLYGIAVVKVFLQPNASLDQAIAQITASSQTQLRLLPPGTTPPLIIAYSASSVPVLQLALSGNGLSEQQLNDYGFESGAISTLLQGPSGLWAVGASAMYTVFDAGRRRAMNDEAMASYDTAVASYRQTVLSAFQQVEDNLAALRVLEHEAEV